MFHLVATVVSPRQGVTPETSAPSDTVAATGGKTPSQRSESIILHNATIIGGKTKTVDISFVPKTVGLIGTGVALIKGRLQGE